MEQPPRLAAVRCRLVLHAPGFEPLPPAEHRRRFAAALTRAERSWGITAEAGPGTFVGDRAVFAFPARASGPDWRTETEIRLLAWDDLIEAELAASGIWRLVRGVAALCDVLLSSTLARYFAAHWRYGLFALYPMALVVGAVAISAAVGRGAGGVIGVVLMLCVLATLLWAADRYLRLGILLADWRFAMEIARDRHAGFAARRARFTEEIAAALARRDVDEVVLVGHSLGAVFVVEALAEVLRRDPGALRGGPRFALVGLGSSVLKIALHPRATRLRADLALLAATPGLVWVDHASRRDVLSFERAEPIRTLGLPGRGPRLERVHPRDMVDAATWSRIRRHPLRIHRQYVLGNARRYFFDIAILTCGPLTVESGIRPDHALGPDGAVRLHPASVATDASAAARAA